jgi:acyl-coenzyme A synthetase/AMP-(fatty) acid ligase
VLDDDGFLTVTDRKKDIIIRGGENISCARPLRSVRSHEAEDAELLRIVADTDLPARRRGKVQKRVLRDTLEMTG